MNITIESKIKFTIILLFILGIFVFAYYSMANDDWNEMPIDKKFNTISSDIG
ncbi:MAG: hypothetical protein V2A72_05090 [Candidatus Omnitrophota bacterium]